MTECANAKDRAAQLFVLRDFLNQFNDEKMIPIPLMEQEMMPREARGC